MRPIITIKSKVFDIKDKILGAGSFSTVKLAVKKGDTIPIALKIIHVMSETDWLQSLNEICLLGMLRHQSIISIVDYEITKFHVLIGLSQGQGTLREFMQKNPLEELRKHGQVIMEQIIDALNYLEFYRIVHSDVKPENIIYFRDIMPSIQLMDFGLSHVIGIPSGIKIGDGGGTKKYMAPEKLLRQYYDETSDLFSAGIIFFEIQFKFHPFYTEGVDYVEYMRKKPKPRFPQNWELDMYPSGADLLKTILSFDPVVRCQARRHEFIRLRQKEKQTQDHYRLAIEIVKQAKIAESNLNYPHALVCYMKAILTLSFAFHQSLQYNNREVINLHIGMYKSKMMSLFTTFRNSYNFEAPNGCIIYDEFYEYLMDVTNSTRSLKGFLEIGYFGELYLQERKSELAYNNFINALEGLNPAMIAEPPGDRKTIIGKKMLQWTNTAELLKQSLPLPSH